jgi:hypothetical protein
MWKALALAGLALSPAAAPAADTPVLRSAAALAAARFTLAAPPSRAFLDPAFDRQLPALRAEAERIRAGYAIADPALANELRTGLAAIALLQARPAEARAMVAEARAAAVKPQGRALALLPYEALAAGMAPDGRINCPAAAAQVARTLTAGDAALIRDEARSRLVQIETVSGPYQAGYVEAEIDPKAAAQGGVGLLDGLSLAVFRTQVRLLVPCRAEIGGTIRAWLADPEHQPQNIWPAREPAPAALAGARPVVVAVWDGGYDTALFGAQLAIDPAEPLDGQDNDGNGVVDDWNGPTFGWRLEPLAASIPPPSATLAPHLAFQMALAKGEGDLHEGLATAESDLFARRARDAGQADQALDTLLWAEMGTRDHGTKVASLLADGAPFVRLYNMLALPFGLDPQPVPLDEGQIARWVRAIDAAGPRLRGAGVRIVNMSWGITADEIAQNLLRTRMENDQARANRRGRAMFADAEAALRRLIGSCPGILFVAGAGNSDQSDEILAAAPQSIAAPNLLIVGAAGVNGQATRFTTYGKSVGLYAWGDGVTMRLPGGMPTRGAGTSYAGPLVARAAAAMLAINPGLTPAQLVAGLAETATTGEGGLKLLHPAAALQWARNR